MKDEERKDLMGLVMDAAESCSAAIWVNPSPNAPPSSVNDNGTCAFVDTGQRKLLVTANHVFSDFIEKQQKNPQAVLCVCLGSVSMYLDSPVVVDFDDETLDLAVIEFPHLDRIRNHQKRYFPIRGFPIPVARPGEAVTLVGFPGAQRFTHQDFGAFEPAGLGFAITSVSDRTIVLADENATRRTEGIGFREDEDIPLGGFSGTPGFVARQNGFHLVGFLRGGSKQLAGEPAMVLPGVVFLSPATYLQPDGTFDRLRMPYCPSEPRNGERVSP
jgi:hypothetical protein